MKYYFAGIILILFSILYKWSARKLNIVDEPDGRSSHRNPVILGGGILVYIALGLFFILSGFEFHFFFLGVSLIAFVSFLDDIFILTINQRLPVHFLGIIAVILEFNDFDIIPSLLVGLVFLGVYFINCFNFIDGINGMIGFYSIIYILSLLYLNVLEEVISQEILVFTLFASLVFGYYNFRKKALFFAGDVGSLTLGTFIFFTCSWFIFNLKAPVLVLLVSVCLIESGLTILWRFLKGKKITQPHRNHIYERITDVLKWNHLKTSTIYNTIQLSINVIAIYFYEHAIAVQVAITIGILSILALCYLIILAQLQRLGSP